MVAVVRHRVGGESRRREVAVSGTKGGGRAQQSRFGGRILRNGIIIAFVVETENWMEAEPGLFVGDAAEKDEVERRNRQFDARCITGSALGVAGFARPGHAVRRAGQGDWGVRHSRGIGTEDRLQAPLCTEVPLLNRVAGAQCDPSNRHSWVNDRPTRRCQDVAFGFRKRRPGPSPGVAVLLNSRRFLQK
jgi:hypothetical protein